uniref:Prostaglandin reductase 1 n=1 Tax=Culicoides sonorensis TaxID=179676 RepID=A0A336LIG0_CULSO
MLRAKKIIKINEFVNEPKLGDFQIVEEDLPPLKDGEFLIEAEYISVDPYMRVFDVKPLNTMIGDQVSKVIQSKNTKYPVGTFVFAQTGWRTHTIINPKDSSFLEQNFYKLDYDFGKHPRSLAVGTCGMPGNTAYFGFLEICKPKAGEVLVVTGAAGAVGSLVGQIGKLKGLTVIGFAGSDEKCEWLKNELNFDYVINYKTDNCEAKLKEAAPDGIDCYFDNVGGALTSIILRQMRLFGRISVCGAISGYNNDTKSPILVPVFQQLFIYKQLTMQGFMVYQWKFRWSEGVEQMLKWVKEGYIKYHETITAGFENTPEAFINMLNGKSIGKAIVKVK